MSEQSGGYPGAPPGWYSDPAGGPGQRWWDGYAWTEATVLPQQPPPPPWAEAEPPQGPPLQPAPWAAATDRFNAHTTSRLVDEELRLAPTARLAVIMPAVYIIVGLIVQRINAAQLRMFGHEFRVVWDDTRNHITPPTYRGPSGFSPAELVVGLVTVRGDHRRLYLAAPGRVGCACARVAGRQVASLGGGVLVRADREPLDALRRHPGLPAAGRPAPGPGPAMVDRPARRHQPLRRRQHLLADLHRARARRCPSRRRWLPWPSSRGHRGLWWRSPPRTGRPSAAVRRAQARPAPEGRGGGLAPQPERHDEPCDTHVVASTPGGVWALRI